MEDNKSLDKIFHELKERAKELNCLYEVQELLNNYEQDVEEIYDGIIKAIPPGWQYPDVCKANIIIKGTKYQPDNFTETQWVQSSNVIVNDEVIGSINVYYTEERPAADEGPFLKEERKLIDTIADQFGLFILHRQLKTIFEEQKNPEDQQKSEWWVIIDLLKRTDPKLLIRISRRMINFLFWRGIEEVENLMEHFSPSYKKGFDVTVEINRPYKKQISSDILVISNDIFKVAEKHLTKQEILEYIQKWIKEDRSSFLVNILEDSSSSLSEISGAIERFHHLEPHGIELSTPREKSLRVALTRRLLTEQPHFVNIAKQTIEVKDFYNLIERIIFPLGSHGRLGGKSSGLFLAKQILKKATTENNLLDQIKTPNTWYITSDGIFNLMNYNDLQDVIEQKYKDIGQVRQEYPYIIQVFKNSLFDPEIIKGLSLALDDLGEVPLIVRSSSLLEDQVGATFAGKYKSLFLANRGAKEKRLIELMDAIAEVYASTFGPDPVEYRAEHGLLDYHEEMGIMIQEVVGKKVGKYFFPAFAGVAFSKNEFRWSSRIKREDGLVRLVLGLGTRAVDRLSDDYPVLFAPGQPGLRVNVTPDEIIRYSPKKIDVINLETQTFETIDIDFLLKNYGEEYPQLSKLVSVLENDHLKKIRTIGTNFKKDELVVTFNGLLSETSFVKKVIAILKELEKNYGDPVDIEFAHDGDDFYLLQCRSQSFSEDSQPAIIPANLSKEKIIFSAHRYVTNGIISGISYIVYVDPSAYSELPDQQNMLSVGEAIGRLNKILPRRKFVLIGPGRWGSRGDIKLGVSISYSEINNTAMLIEVARKQKDYVPDLSFGTHFFQDLVEAKIRYLPLYPDEEGNILNEEFLLNSKNYLHKVLPEFKSLAKVIKVIDFSQLAKGLQLDILMNGDDDEAVAVLTDHNDSL